MLTRPEASTEGVMGVGQEPKGEVVEVKLNQERALNRRRRTAQEKIGESRIRGKGRAHRN